jgi:hypothetical protein
MATATLEFNLEIPEDQRALERALKSTDMAIAIHSIEQMLFRTKERYTENKQIADLADIISRIISEYDIKTENLIE